MLQEALQKVATTLDNLHIPYALIGGLAVITRGVVRATQDVDLLVDWPLREGASLAKSLTENGAPATFHKGAADDPVAGVIRVVFPGRPSPVRCDVLFASKAWQADAVRKAVPVDLKGLAVPVVQSQDLFLLKLHAGGPQDLLDAAELLRMQTDADRTAWEALAAKRRMSSQYKRCLKFLNAMD